MLQSSGDLSTSVPFRRHVRCRAGDLTCGYGERVRIADVCDQHGRREPQPEHARLHVDDLLRSRARVYLVALLIVAAALAGGSRESAAATPSSAKAATSGSVKLRLVAIGDSIPYNSPQDCPGCTGFVDRYARAVAKKPAAASQSRTSQSTTT
jgi:hypothetical protein